MPHADFVHLRVHSLIPLGRRHQESSNWSISAGATAWPAVAVTDTGNLFSAMGFRASAKDAGIQPIIGCQLGWRAIATPTRRRSQRPDQLVLLVQNEIGYRQSDQTF